MSKFEKNNVSRGGSGRVDVILKDLSDHPSCPHGPTLLFRREKYKFYACSACRNRKDCSFFMLEEDWIRKKKISTTLIDSSRPIVHAISRDSLEKIKKASQFDRAYCHTCAELFLRSEDNEKHLHHDLKQNIDASLLPHPSRILKTLENDKKEAQYLFSQKCVSTVMDVLKHNNLKNIICLGTPSIHEHIQQHCFEKGLTSILLDIDSRHRAFYESNKFCHYNIFNNHFFEDEEKSVFEKFLQKNLGNNMCIIMDPPFGGRMEPLSQTLREISKLHQDINKLKEKSNEVQLPIMLVSPYFMEPQIKNHTPYLEMCDYQVTYANHLNFKDEKVSKGGSPVRIFTNIPLKNFKLPTEDGYKFCKTCLKWIGGWNKHCPKCKCCTSKNGKPYLHCDVCDRCVKASWEHCNRCNRCSLREHTCGIILKEQICFNCKELGHKKADCPKSAELLALKRKKGGEGGGEAESVRKILRTDENKSTALDTKEIKTEAVKTKKILKKERRAQLRLNRKKSILPV